MIFNEITKTPVCIAAIICATIILICLIACISDMVKTAIKEKTTRVLDEQKYFYSRLTADDIRAMAGIATFEKVSKDEFEKIFSASELQQEQKIDFPNKTIETRPANPTFDTDKRPLNEKYH